MMNAKTASGKFREDIEFEAEDVLDLHARYVLAERLGVVGRMKVMRDEERVVLDCAEDVERARDILGAVSDDDLEVRLWWAYESAVTEASELLHEQEEVCDGSTRTHWLHTWAEKDGWYYCFSGLTWEGEYFESRDVGPYTSREDALAAAHAWLGR